MSPNAFQRKILFALPRMGRHIYAGTVPATEIAHRRKKNRAARKARRLNRSSK